MIGGTVLETYKLQLRIAVIEYLVTGGHDITQVRKCKVTWVGNIAGVGTNSISFLNSYEKVKCRDKEYDN